MIKDLQIVKKYRSTSKSYGWSRSDLDVCFFNQEFGIRVKHQGDNRYGGTTSLDSINPDEIRELEKTVATSQGGTMGDTSRESYVRTDTIEFEETIFEDLVSRLIPLGCEKIDYKRVGKLALHLYGHGVDYHLFLYRLSDYLHFKLFSSAY